MYYVVPHVTYGNEWEWHLEDPPSSRGDVVMRVKLQTHIKIIPIPTFMNEGWWVDLVHSSYISALSLVGKQIWQPEPYERG